MQRRTARVSTISTRNSVTRSAVVRLLLNHTDLHTLGGRERESEGAFQRLRRRQVIEVMTTGITIHPYVRKGGQIKNASGRRHIALPQVQSTL